MNANKLHNVVRRTLLGGTFLTALAFSATAMAQDQDAEDAADEEDRIVVTGSRIAKPDYAFSNPVVSLDASSIQYSGETNLTDLLTQLPALTGSQDTNDESGSNESVGGAGVNQLNLRNLGLDRTLVLVDGRRHVGARPGSVGVDLNTIPIDLVESIQISTGGASAIYGADGVTGVVNFIMKDDFEGVSIRGQAGLALEEGDADQQQISIVVGQNFDDDRGNVAFAFEFNNTERLPAIARDFADGPARLNFVDNPALVDPSLADQFGTTFTNVPIADDRFADSSPDGAIFTSGFGASGSPFGVDFNGTGEVWDAGTIPFIPPFLSQGGDGSERRRFIGDLLSGQKRYNANFFGNYELAPNHRAFAQFKFVRTETESFSQPSFDFFLFLDDDNPFVPAPIRADLDTLGPGDTAAEFFFGLPRGFLLSRDHFEAVRGSSIDRETLRGVVGFDGTFSDRFDYSLSYVYGQSKVDDLQINNRFNDRFGAALDAVIDPSTGQPTCRTNLDPTATANMLINFGLEPTTFTPGANSGCAPFNPFGEGSPSQASLDFVFQDTLATSKVSQHVVSGYVTTDTTDWFELPGGPVGLLVGGEWRREESESQPNQFDRDGLTFGNALEPEMGDFDVVEGFAEVNLPVVADLPYVQFLNLDAAVRVSDYNTIGTTLTWKGGMAWQVIDDVRFRGTIAQAVRAPNIGELFDPGGQTFRFISDPCDVSNLSEGEPPRAANCAAILNAFGIDPTTFVDPNSASIPGTLRGNPDLSEETARTYTAGVILQPQFIPGLTISGDWYDITIEDAIITALPGTLADLCVDTSTLDNQFCDQITRDPATGGIIDFVQSPLNVAEISTAGVDVAANYVFDVADLFGAQGDWGQTNARLIGNRTLKLDIINFPGDDVDNDLGEGGDGANGGIQAPKWQLSFDATWSRGPLSMNYGFNYFSRTTRYSDTQIENDPNIAAPEFIEHSALFSHDFQIRYEIGDQIEIYGGINNFTDQEPDIGEIFFPVSAIGRFGYVGFRADFASLSDLNPF